jgi:hypothetical protein
MFFHAAQHDAGLPTTPLYGGAFFFFAWFST